MNISGKVVRKMIPMANRLIGPFIFAAVQYMNYCFSCHVDVCASVQVHHKPNKKLAEIHQSGTTNGPMENATPSR